MSNPFTAEQEKEPSTLTMDDLLEAIELVFPTLYYQCSEHIEIGSIYLIKEEQGSGFLMPHPEYIIIHPDDLDEVIKKINWRTLKPLSANHSADDWRYDWMPFSDTESMRKEMIDSSEKSHLA